MKPLLRLYVLSAAALLLASGLIHLLNAAGHAQVLALPEPLLGLPLRYGLLGAGALEITVALICLLGKPGGLQLCWLAWMGTNLLVYHVGLIWSGCHLECTCIGYPTDPLHLSRSAAALLLNGITIYLAAGSYAALLLHWLASAKNPSIHQSTNQSLGSTTPPASEDYLRMSCPHCSGHISFPAQRLGQSIPCPHCSKALTLQPSTQSGQVTTDTSPKLPAAAAAAPQLP